MIVLAGLALLVLTVYISTLSFVMRLYSRTRLAERLPDDRADWVEWLERHETELQMLTSFLRATLNLSLLIWAWVWVTGGMAAGQSLWAVILPAAIALTLVVIFAIGLPHALALHAGEIVLARSLRLLAALRLVFLLVVRSLMGIDFLVRRVLGRPDTAQQDQTERKEQEILDAISEAETHGAVDEEQKQMIESVFELKETTVAEIMTPRTEFVAIRADATFEEARNVALEGHSRTPVFEESLDHIVGVMYAKDLLAVSKPADFTVRSIMRSVPYVPETKTVRELLRELKQQKVHIAIVLDEYGGTAGLVTIEDIIELVLGDIDDEYDEPDVEAVQQVDEETFEVDARTRLAELNARLQLDLPEGEYETIGGFLLSTMGRIPAAGEIFEFGNVHFEILSAEPRRIQRVRIRTIKPAEAGA